MGVIYALFHRYFVGVVCEGCGGFERGEFVVIGLLTIDTIFVQVVLLLMGSSLCCFEGEQLLLF